MLLNFGLFFLAQVCSLRALANNTTCCFFCKKCDKKNNYAVGKRKGIKKQRSYEARITLDFYRLWEKPTEPTVIKVVAIATPYYLTIIKTKDYFYRSLVVYPLQNEGIFGLPFQGILWLLVSFVVLQISNTFY